jgi:hypothetical protein
VPGLAAGSGEFAPVEVYVGEEEITEGEEEKVEGKGGEVVESVIEGAVGGAWQDESGDPKINADGCFKNQEDRGQFCGTFDPGPLTCKFLVRGLEARVFHPPPHGYSQGSEHS